MNTIGYFEIQSSDPQREIKFYAEVFGWRFSRDSNLPIEYYRIETAGINGGMLLRPAKTPGDQFGTNAFCCSVEVADFDITAKKILDNGGRVAMPKFAIRGKCWQGYFIDADHNTFGIFQVDENAAEGD
jgi:predicted enzyme related to lactoylglutathione lyase